MAGRYYPTRPAKMMGKMTLSFGSAQIIAPALAGLLAEHSGSYTNAVYMAAFIMALGSVLLLVLKSREPAKQPQLAPIS
jgi:cyanate permease